MGLALSMMAEGGWRDILLAEESDSFVRAFKCGPLGPCSLLPCSSRLLFKSKQPTRPMFYLLKVPSHSVWSPCVELPSVPEACS